MYQMFCFGRDVDRYAPLHSTDASSMMGPLRYSKYYLGNDVPLPQHHTLSPTAFVLTLSNARAAFLSVRSR